MYQGYENYPTFTVALWFDNDRERKTLARLSRWHAEQHHRYGSASHHHGPNPGPHDRPEGWFTGGNVIMKEG